jgi:acyl transferase domain-containing protein
VNAEEHYKLATEAYEKARVAGQARDKDSVGVYVNAAQFHALMAIAAPRPHFTITGQGSN